jgi:hypothetical protein
MIAKKTVPDDLPPFSKIEPRRRFVKTKSSKKSPRAINQIVGRGVPQNLIKAAIPAMFASNPWNGIMAEN